MQYIYTTEQLVKITTILEYALISLSEGKLVKMDLEGLLFGKQRGSGGSGSGSSELKAASLSALYASVIVFVDEGSKHLRDTLDTIATTGSIGGSVMGCMEDEDKSTSTGLLWFALGCKVVSFGITATRQLVGANTDNAGRLAHIGVEVMSLSGAHPNFVGPSWAATAVLVPSMLPACMRRYLFPNE